MATVAKWNLRRQLRNSSHKFGSLSSFPYHSFSNSDTATLIDSSKEKRRKRCRAQQGLLFVNNSKQSSIQVPQALSFMGATRDIQRLLVRNFSSTRASMDEHSINANIQKMNNRENNTDKKNTIEHLEQQLDELLEGNGGFFQPNNYRNVWTLAPNSAGTNESGSNEVSKNITSKGSRRTSRQFRLFPLDSDPRLDRQSRFLLELLQTLQEVGLTHTNDRVTTERCNAIIQRLATPPEQNNTNSDENEDVSTETQEESSASPQRSKNPTVVDFSSILDTWQRIERARTILESMESYIPIQQTSGNQIPMELPVPSHETYFTILKLYSSAKQLSVKHLSRFRQINHAVAASKNNSGNHEDCVALLEAANEAPLVATAIVEKMEASGKLALMPSDLHWNQVLSCYANAIRRQNRPLEAATLLYKLAQSKPKTSAAASAVGKNNNSSTKGRGLTDASSFLHALRACSDDVALKNYEKYRSGSSTLPTESSSFWKNKEAFAKLALAVAQRIWKGLQEEQVIIEATTTNYHTTNSNSQTRQDHLTGLLDSNEIPDANGNDDDLTTPMPEDTIAMRSHHFVHMLKAGRNFAPLFSLEQQNRIQEQPTATASEGRELMDLRRRHQKWMQRIFNECCQHRKVNIHVLQEIVYQGAVLAVDNNDSNNDGTMDKNGAKDLLEWVGEIVVPSPDGVSDKDVAQFCERWETEIVPTLLEPNPERQPVRTSNHRSKIPWRDLNSVYANTIPQTRMLLRFLPSQWSARAD